MRPDSLSPDKLLNEVEPLSYGQRCRRLAERGRELAGRPDVLQALLTALSERGPYERLLAAQLAVMTGHLPHLTRAAADPDPDISRYAIGHAIRLGIPDDAVMEIVRDAPAAHRAAAYRAVRRDRRSDLAERLVDEVRGRWGDREAAGLLVVCSAEAVAARLGDLAHAVPNWGALARRHAHTVLDHAESVLAELPRPLREAWWTATASGIEVAATHAPERVIDLLERYPANRSWHCAGRLLDADPVRTLALYLGAGQRHQLTRLLRRRAVRRRLAALPDDRLAEVGRAVRDVEESLIDLLRSVPPARRDALFTEVMADVDQSQATYSPYLLSVLPLRRRVAEARRMLGLRSVAEDPRQTRWITAFLPYDEAEPVLRAATRRSDALDRADGYRSLIACAGRARDPEVVTRMLATLGRLRNEQDPVRQAAVQALTGIPPRLWTAGHVPVLDRFVEDAVNARDCSYQTRLDLSRLAAAIFEEGARQDEPAMLEYGLRVLERLAGSVGTVSVRRLSRVLRRGQEGELVRRLAPYLEAEARHDRHQLAFLLAEALDRRGHDLPELQRALERALTATGESDAIKAVDFWLAPPRTRGERVEGLLAADPSVVMLGSVFDELAARRTDLLRYFLGRRARQGRFAQSGVRRVRYVPRQFVRRWTARQREAYAELLERVVGNTSLPLHERAQAVRMLGEVPAIEARRLRHLESEVLLRRAMLTTLPWTARPQEVLAELLSYAGSDDAHVAVSAAARAARFVRPAELPAALEPVLAEGKITARKEAVRLLAGHHAPGAMARLRGLWEAEGQHKDVRVAIVSAVLGLLDEPGAWDLLTEAVAMARGVPRAAPGAGTGHATDGVPGGVAGGMAGGVAGDAVADLVAPVLGAQPLDVPSRWRAAFGELIIAATLAEERTVRLPAVAALPRWIAHAPGAMERLAEIARDLDDGASWRAAVHGLVTGACSGYEPEVLRRTVRALAAAPAEPDAGAGRDRPAARRLAHVVEVLRWWHRAEGEPIVPGLPDGLPPGLSAELLAGTVDWDAPRPALERLVATVPGVLSAVETGEILAESAEDVPMERVLPQAEWLAGQGEKGALLATALAASCGPRSGWAAPWRELVRRVRASDHPQAAHQALRVTTADE
ncbi:hypothetical protein [Nonomuraea fuscirosea]|uniref:hypothetical protein n=1 Tax=Nonomuraea fuscirosea TaxID=1291556 RepID=UPI0034428C47